MMEVLGAFITITMTAGLIFIFAAFIYMIGLLLYELYNDNKK